VKSSPKVGQVISVPWLDHGRFVIGKMVSGGMGTVYQLVPTKPVDPPLAAKTFQATSTSDQFKRECEIWMSLSSHRFVAQAIAYGELFNAPCVVARWYPKSLAQHPLRSWSSDSVRSFVANLLEALAFTAEERGVIHQDIKPANILLDSSNNPALADFGIARLAPHRPSQIDAGPLRLSRATMNANGIGGTPFYMAPELLARLAIPSVRTDVFSLGVTLFESLTGQHPYFSRDGEVSRLPKMELLSEALAAHKSLADSLHRCIGAMLSLDPASRPSSYQQLKQMISPGSFTQDDGRSDSHTATVGLVMLLRTQGRMAEAQRVIEDALNRNPADPVLLNSRGTLALAMRDQPKAIQAFSSAMRELVKTNGRLNATLPMPYCDPGANLGWQYIMSERFAAADECLWQVWQWLDECRVQRLAAQYPCFGWMLLYRGHFGPACGFFEELSRHHKLNFVSLSWWTLAAYLGNPPAANFATAAGCFRQLAPFNMDQALVSCLLASCAPASISESLSRAAANDSGQQLRAAEKKFDLPRGHFAMPFSRAAQRDIAMSLGHNWTGGNLSVDT
jgi:serine/threonine protein kinase